MDDYVRANPAKWWKNRSAGSASRSPHSTFVSPWRRMTSLTTLVLLVSLIAGIWYLMNPKRLSQMASILLSDVLDGNVTVQTGHISLVGTLQLSGVTLRSRHGHGPSSVLFSAHEVQVTFNWLGLITGRLHALRLVAIRPTLNLVNNLDTGRWNYESFMHHQASAPSTGHNPIQSLPVILLHHASIRWGQISKGVYRVVGESFVDGRLQPSVSLPSTYRFEMDQRSSPGGKPGIRMTGSWNLSAHEFIAHIARIALDQSLRRGLPLEVQNFLSKYQVRGDLSDIAFHLDPATGMALRITLAGVTFRIPLVSPQLGKHIVPITRLSGTLNFSRSDISIHQLSGQVMGNIFRIPIAHFDGYTSAAPFHIRLDMPDLRIPRHIPAVIQMPGFGAARAIFLRLRPSGLMDMTMTVDRITSGDAPTVHGQIILKNVRARYVHFPYPLHHVHGVVDFSNRKIRFVHVQAIADTYPCSLDGMVGINSDSAPIDLRIASKDAYFDRRLADCLPKAIHQVWNRFHPHGTGRFICHVTRAAGTTTEPLIAIHIFPVDVTGSYRDFPYPLTHIHGEIYFTPTHTQIIRLVASGPSHHGKIVFTGNVNYSASDIAAMQPKVRMVASDISINRTLVNSLPRRYQNWIKKLHATGRISMDAMITRGVDGEPSVAGNISLLDGTLHPKQFPWPLTQVVAQASIAPYRFDIVHMTASAGPDHLGKLNLQANMTQNVAGDWSVNTSGNWQSIDLTPVPPQVLPPQLKTLWADWHPIGPIDGTFAVAVSVPKQTRSAAKPMNLTSLNVKIIPRGISLSPSAFPDKISVLSGNIRITRKQLTLQKLIADAGPIHINLGGDYSFLTHTLNISGNAASKIIAPAWITRLPPKPRGFLTPLAPRAAWTLRLDKLIRAQIKGKSHWSFQGELGLNDLSSHGDIQAQCEHASINFSGNWNALATAPTINATFALKDLSIAGQTLQSLNGNLSTSPITRLLTLEQINGAIAGGTLSGNFSLSMGKLPLYRANLILDHAELADLLSSPPSGTSTALSGTSPQLLHSNSGNSTHQSQVHLPTPVANIHPILPPPTSRPTSTQPATTRPHPDRDDIQPPRTPSLNTGKVTASLQMTGIWGSPQTMHGNGILLLRHADIYNVPLAMGLLQVATLRLPISQAFHSGKIVYTLDNGYIHFQHIILKSSGVNLTGSGSIQMASKQLNLTLATHSPAGTRIPILGPFISIARSQLLQLRVYGTLDHPVIVPIALSILEWPFRVFSH